MQHKKLAVAGFSGIASEVRYTCSNALISTILICHENLGSTDSFRTGQMLYSLPDTAVKCTTFLLHIMLLQV